MVQIGSDLENNHTGMKQPTMAVRLGFLVKNFLYNCLKPFIGIPIQILIIIVVGFPSPRVWGAYG